MTTPRLAAFVIVLELLSNNVMEHLLYGRGISILAIGCDLGLALGTSRADSRDGLPRRRRALTYALTFYNPLLGDVPTAAHFIYYQRLLARDDEELRLRSNAFPSSSALSKFQSFATVDQELCDVD